LLLESHGIVDLSHYVGNYPSFPQKPMGTRLMAIVF
jgi:hypothetical protein